MMERRELFKIIGAGALAAPAVAQSHLHESAEGAARAKQAAFFGAAQRATLDRLSEIIIPADESSPGAHEAGVVEYLDLLVGHSPASRQREWRQGIEVVEGAAQARYGRGFINCSAEQQVEMVTLMARNEPAPQNELERFFALLKPAVVDGYRFSEVGVKQYMGWVGNQFDTRTWRGACTHPEHQA